MYEISRDRGPKASIAYPNGWTRLFKSPDIGDRPGWLIVDKRLSKAVKFTTRKAWRRWLEQNHASKEEVLLVLYKREPRTGTLSNLDAIEEALCFGWIDGWFRPIDAERKVQRYTPRRKGSSWSEYNIARAWKLLRENRMTPAGRAKLPADVVSVWKDHRPRVIEVDPRNRVIRFADDRIDFLSMIKRPALTP